MKTAVEYLVEQLFELRNPTLNQIQIIKKAKEIEKQQIIESGNSCALSQHIHNEKVNNMTESELIDFSEKEVLTFGEEYYNKTFNK